MEEHRKASRRFWEEGPAAVAAARALSPPSQQENQQGPADMLGRHPPATPATAVSHAKISAAVGVEGARADGEARQGSSELSKLPFKIEDGEQLTLRVMGRCRVKIKIG